MWDPFSKSGWLVCRLVFLQANFWDYLFVVIHWVLLKQTTEDIKPICSLSKKYFCLFFVHGVRNMFVYCLRNQEFICLFVAIHEVVNMFLCLLSFIESGMLVSGFKLEIYHCYRLQILALLFLQFFLLPAWKTVFSYCPPLFLLLFILPAVTTSFNMCLMNWFCLLWFQKLTFFPH